MKDGFVRVACATPRVKVADCAFNAEQVIALANEAAEKGAALAVFPELCLTAYTCGDLFTTDTLLSGALEALKTMLDGTKALQTLLVVGLPLALDGALYNVAAVLLRGEVLGLVPKRNIPNYGEFYEARHFASGTDARLIPLLGKNVPFGAGLVFACEELSAFKLGVEICEDLWVAEPPSNALSRMGVTVMANPSASNEVVGKAEYRRKLLAAQSAKTLCAYVYTDAGEGESTQDMVFSGHDLIYENATLLAQSKRFTTGLTLADVDVKRLEHERLRTSTFVPMQPAMQIPFSLPLRELTLIRRVDAKPFVPKDDAARAARCEEILTMQAVGLATRLNHTGAKTVVLGLSGGLDSTLALIVAAHAFDRLSLPRKGILTATMPCFGTTKRTRSNAELLAQAYGTDFAQIDITNTVKSHFKDISLPDDDRSVTFENAQARERTQVLMDLANKVGGLVIGTGDLSELALGWATYNGDHMSMYGVNASIPKTLVRYLVEYEASNSDDKLAAVLRDVLATPVSPELLPPKDGDIAQKTEDIVGPYELHDFYLYYTVRFGMEPRKVYRLAKAAFAGEYSDEVIKKWLCTFLRRFFSQQFKRSCLPDGPKVGSVTLSPRGDWRMPSDACAALWLKQAQAL